MFIVQLFTYCKCHTPTPLGTTWFLFGKTAPMKEHINLENWRAQLKFIVFFITYLKSSWSSNLQEKNSLAVNERYTLKKQGCVKCWHASLSLAARDFIRCQKVWHVNFLLVADNFTLRSLAINKAQIAQWTLWRMTCFRYVAFKKKQQQQQHFSKCWPASLSPSLKTLFFTLHIFWKHKWCKI